MAIIGVMPMPPPSRIERVAPAASGNRLRGALICTSRPSTRASCTPAEPPREAGSFNTPRRYTEASAGSLHSEYWRTRPGATWISTCAPASNAGKAAPSARPRSSTTTSAP
ncbi:hypothetical protein D3C80_1475520 [compost metagenome]